MKAYYLVFSIFVILVSSSNNITPLVKIILNPTMSTYKLSENQNLQKVDMSTEKLTINLSNKYEFLKNDEMKTFYKVESGNGNLYVKDGDFKLFDNEFDEKEAMDPKDLAFKLDMPDKRVQSSITQNIYSRALMYFPNELVVNEIQKLAEMFVKLVNKIKEKTSLIAKKLRVNKMTSTRKDLLDLLSFQILSNNEYVGFQINNSQEYLFQNFEKVAANKGNITTEDRIVVLTVLGNISDMFSFRDEESIALKDHIMNLLPIIQEIIPIMEYLNITNYEKLQRINGYLVSKVQKKRERISHSDLKYKRTGIFSLGPIADNIIEKFLSKEPDKLQKEKIVLNSNKLKPIGWPVYYLPVSRIIAFYAEASSGHIAGRVGEMNFFWDVLLGNNPLKPYDHTLPGEEETEDRKKLKISIISSWLISLGYHSAAEVYEGSLEYLKKSKDAKENENSTNLQFQGNATKFFTNLFRNYMTIDIPIKKVENLITKKEFLKEVEDFLTKETEKTTKKEIIRHNKKTKKLR